ncbi:MAG: N-acetyl-gamma-glutamyl-phosphate reductase [Caldiserica bacterium]|nr:MAG: N-acetyl-gamma-glutamyl-phosphate reductase [Caldisericota bacterium]
MKIGIFGGSGFVGQELIRILTSHKNVEIAFVTSNEFNGNVVSSVFPNLPLNIKFISHEEGKERKVDFCFLALPHTKSAPFANHLYKKGIKFVDLSGDSRFRDKRVFEEWYKVKHQSPGYLKETVYGLPEIFREEIRNASIVGNPGCYPTSVILPLYPLIKNGVVKEDTILVDSKSGVTGAGRKPKETTHFVNVYENFKVYSLGRSHRHVGEMEYILKRKVYFTASLLPIRRGILSTIYFKLKKIGVMEKILTEFYGKEKFVKLYPSGSFPQIKDVVYSNRCDIGFLEEEDLGIIVSTIDNLVKGAAGQAIQNMNIMTGFREDEGLTERGISL